MKITIISFSSRPNGNCASIAKEVSKILMGEELINFDFSSFSLTPCGNCNFECFNNRLDCPNINDKAFSIYNSITNSDYAIFIVPNHCDYPNANFFIYNERSLCYFQNCRDLLDTYEKVKKKFIVVSNTNKDNFINVFKYHTINEPDILFLAPKLYGKKSIAGDLMKEKIVINDLNKFLDVK